MRKTKTTRRLLLLKWSISPSSSITHVSISNDSRLCMLVLSNDSEHTSQVIIIDASNGNMLYTEMTSILESAVPSSNGFVFNTDNQIWKADDHKISKVLECKPHTVILAAKHDEIVYTTTTKPTIASIYTQPTTTSTASPTQTTPTTLRLKHRAQTAIYTGGWLLIAGADGPRGVVAMTWRQGHQSLECSLRTSFFQHTPGERTDDRESSTAAASAQSKRGNNASVRAIIAGNGHAVLLLEGGGPMFTAVAASPSTAAILTSKTKLVAPTHATVMQLDTVESPERIGPVAVALGLDSELSSLIVCTDPVVCSPTPLPAALKLMVLSDTGVSQLVLMDPLSHVGAFLSAPSTPPSLLTSQITRMLIDTGAIRPPATSSSSVMIDKRGLYEPLGELPSPAALMACLRWAQLDPVLNRIATGSTVNHGVSNGKPEFSFRNVRPLFGLLNRVALNGQAAPRTLHQALLGPAVVRDSTVDSQQHRHLVIGAQGLSRLCGATSSLLSRLVTSRSAYQEAVQRAAGAAAGAAAARSSLSMLAMLAGWSRSRLDLPLPASDSVLREARDRLNCGLKDSKTGFVEVNDDLSLSTSDVVEETYTVDSPLLTDSLLRVLGVAVEEQCCVRDLPLFMLSAIHFDAGSGLGAVVSDDHDVDAADTLRKVDVVGILLLQALRGAGESDSNIKTACDQLGLGDDIFAASKIIWECDFGSDINITCDSTSSSVDVIIECLPELGLSHLQWRCRVALHALASQHVALANTIVSGLTVQPLSPTPASLFPSHPAWDTAEILARVRLQSSSPLLVGEGISFIRQHIDSLVVQPKTKTTKMKRKMKSTMKTGGNADGSMSVSETVCRDPVLLRRLAHMLCSSVASKTLAGRVLGCVRLTTLEMQLISAHCASRPQLLPFLAAKHWARGSPAEALKVARAADQSTLTRFEEMSKHLPDVLKQCSEGDKAVFSLNPSDHLPAFVSAARLPRDRQVRFASPEGASSAQKVPRTSKVRVHGTPARVSALLTPAPFHTPFPSSVAMSVSSRFTDVSPKEPHPLGGLDPGASYGPGSSATTQVAVSSRPAAGTPEAFKASLTMPFETPFASRRGNVIVPSSEDLSSFFAL
eukprot:gnl/Dysnectes_brevis/3064_a3804_667.p1 GENE.gnl/Dysnectes_brevis/3064_a3804_667~~gnl/Dysnectes_brevis/3064_a3804_667.p1  ORF type:complete len:1152 (-),score=145.99 gnl/Dysnectes_brevis/3064_a3804_667:63-3374(-)